MDRPRVDRETRGPPSRKGLGAGLAVGATVVVLYELWALVRFLAGGEAGLERGAVWTILLMIAVTFLTVGGIGWGFYRAFAARRDDDGPRGGATGG